MCGIYGMVAREGAAGADHLPAMDGALAHRGPDDTGTLLDGACALGMRRLAIIDVDGGRQPIASEDRTCWVVANGEIYNYRSLRDDLQRRGHTLSTASDTEVIVHLYEERGEGFVEALRGMFAIALWDRRSHTLLLARDRLGIKPLYYVETPSAFLFASELRALLAHPEVSRALDSAALSHYLSFGTTPLDRAIIAGVRKLPPAHLLTVRQGRVVAMRRWWSLGMAAAVTGAGDAPGSEDAAVERVRALVDDAVRCHLESDVPVGAFLSGGLDSASVVASMASMGRRPLTFSIGFDEASFDELRFARRVAAQFGTEHEELVVRPDVWSLTGELVPILDEPLADASAIPTWLVSRLAARKVKVVLSGDGGDEVFGGYDRYPKALADARRFDHLPPLLRRGMGALSSLLPQVALGKRWLRYASLPPRLRFLDGVSLFPDDLKQRLLTADAAAHLRDAGAPDPIEERAALLERAPGDALGRLLWLDTMTYLPLDILTKVDRMAMACSLEVRPPLLDHPLVEAVAAMPSAWKVGPGGRKMLLRRAVADRLPPEILARRKQGFGVPLRQWFRGPLRGPLTEVLLERRTRERGLLSPTFVRALLDEHTSGRRDQSLRLWSLFVLELWIRRVLEGEAAHPGRSWPAPRGPVAAVGGSHG